MARLVEGFYSLLHTYTLIHKWNEPYMPLLSQLKLVLIYWFGWMEGWVGLGTTMMSKKSAKDCCVTGITVISCSNRHAWQGNWSAVAVSIMTSWALSCDANHWATKSPNSQQCVTVLVFLWWQVLYSVWHLIPLSGFCTRAAVIGPSLSGILAAQISPHWNCMATSE